MAKKQTKNHDKLQKTFTWAGLALIILGCAANIYSAYVNQRFIHDPIDIIYYFRFVILLGGGFAVGYFLTKDHSQTNSLFRGVAYAVLTMALFWLFDLARLGVQTLFTPISFPWGKILFEGTPLFAIIAALLIAYFSQLKPKLATISATAKRIVIAGFVIEQIYYLVTSVLINSSANSPWALALNYLTAPLVIALIAYAVLKNIKLAIDRVFYSVVTGVFFFTLTIVLWEFQTDPTYNVVILSSIVNTSLAIVATAALLWRAQSVAK